MRKLKTRTAAVLFAFFALLAACKAPDEATRTGANATAPATEPSAPAVNETTSASQDVRRVSITELQGMLERGEAVAVDVRSKSSYDFGHIRGALSIPRNELKNRLGELPKDKLVVFYCA